MIRTFLGAAAGAVFICLAASAQAAIIYESATLGTTGHTGGSAIFPPGDPAQFLGSRFTLDATYDITSVGGHLKGVGDNGTLFAAIIDLDDNASSPLPSGLPFDGSEVLATALFLAPFASAEVTVPLAVTLGPGTYGLVFGSGLFGASAASGAMPTSNNTGATNIDGAGSYFFWKESETSWFNNEFGPTRFFVAADETGGSSDVPAPSGLALLLLGLAGLGVGRRRRAAR